VENQAVFSPNGSVLKATLVNYTAEENRRLELKFSISYSDDHRKAMDIIRAVAEADEKILKEPSAPLVAMSEHQDSAVTILTRVWVKTDDYWDVRFRLIQTVKEEFDKSGITIPFNQLDVHIDNN
jgi:small conductance mechanosensitive channel